MERYYEYVSHDVESFLSTLILTVVPYRIKLNLHPGVDGYVPNSVESSKTLNRECGFFKAV